MKVQIQIEGMHCESCVQRVTDSLRKVSGVKTAHVDLKSQVANLDITGETPLTHDEISELVKKAGYNTVDFTLPQRSRFRKLVWAGVGALVLVTALCVRHYA